MARVLVADDDAAFRATLAETIEALGHEPVATGSGQDALARLRDGGLDAAFLDFRLPDLDGLEVLRSLRTAPGAGTAPVVMLTAYASADNTIEAIKLGAFDHLVKPVSRAAIERVLDEALRARAAAPEAGAPAAAEAFIARSEAMREVVKFVGRAAASDATVLITGETGSGKEEVARALHRHGMRAARPFVAMNCAAIPRDLLESELFGHVRGAFTGASAARTGYFQQAEGGTLLLDEIGDMSRDLQAKLLRVLEARVVVPVGGERAVPIDVRLVAATHRDLESLVRGGLFREDLFYRLNVLRIHVPPLRERRADIVPLAEHFLSLAADPPKTLAASACEALERHDWPGNVRELRNVIERASVLARAALIEATDLDLASAASADARKHATLPSALAALEEAMIRNALAQSGGNRAEAARRLGIRRQLLYAKLRQYGIAS